MITIHANGEALTPSTAQLLINRVAIQKRGFQFADYAQWRMSIDQAAAWDRCSLLVRGIEEPLPGNTKCCGIVVWHDFDAPLGTMELRDARSGETLAELRNLAVPALYEEEMK